MSSATDLKPVTLAGRGDDTVRLTRPAQPTPLLEVLTAEDKTLLQSVAMTDPRLEQALNYLLGSQATTDEIVVLERGLIKLETSSALKAQSSIYSEHDEVAMRDLKMFRRVRKLRQKFTNYRAATERWSYGC